VKLSQVLWDRLVSQFLPGIVLSITLVWAALAWMFRSARVGAIALIPNLVPLVLLLGIMRLGGFDLKPSTLIVFAIAFGIIADDTIHLLGALSRNLGRAPDVDAALARSVREVGVALIVTTVAVGAGFLVLAASRFQVLFLVGVLTATAAVLALVADLLAFPALLRILSRREGVRAALSSASGPTKARPGR
jgi:predicted RND superfamily exporter protein